MGICLHWGGLWKTHKKFVVKLYLQIWPHVRDMKYKMKTECINARLDRYF